MIYSLVETAGANGLSERGYLHIVLSNLPSMDFHQHPELLKDLMPWSNYMRSCFEQEYPRGPALAGPFLLSSTLFCEALTGNDSDASRNLQNKKAPGYVSITERTRHLLRLLQLRLQASDEHQI